MSGSLIPIVDQGQSMVSGYTNDLEKVVKKGEYVVFGDHTCAIKWVDFEFAPGADGIKVLQAKEGLTPKFSYYALARFKIPSRGYNRHWTVLSDMVIPIPPLAVQEAIVAILDRFDALVNDLSNGLPAEIEARRRQYEYYRDRLLSFKESA